MFRIRIRTITRVLGIGSLALVALAFTAVGCAGTGRTASAYDGNGSPQVDLGSPPWTYDGGQELFDSGNNPPPPPSKDGGLPPPPPTDGGLPPPPPTDGGPPPPPPPPDGGPPPLPDASGGKSCKEILDCVKGCQMMDQTCVSNCVAQGTTAAQQKFVAFDICAKSAAMGTCASACSGGPKSPGCEPCVMQACQNEFASCVGGPPSMP